MVPFGGTPAATTEIVPADYMYESNGFQVYDIPDCNDGWMKASPDAHNAYVRGIDTQHKGKLKPLIRFIKAWKYFRNVPISSFYLEMRVAKYASTESSIFYDIDVERVLARLLDGGLPDMRDPMGISGLISPCKTAVSHADAMSKLDRATTRASNANAASRKLDVGGAFDWWRALYDDQFPTYYR